MPLAKKAFQLFTIAVLMPIASQVWADSLWECRKPIAPNEIRVFELPNYSGRCQSFKLEANMRQLLVSRGATIKRQGSDKRWSVKRGTQVGGLFFPGADWTGMFMLSNNDRPSVNDPMESLLVYPVGKGFPDGVHVTVGNSNQGWKFFPMPQWKNRLTWTWNSPANDMTGGQITLYGQTMALLEYWDRSVSAVNRAKQPPCCSLILPTPGKESNRQFSTDTYDIGVIAKVTVAGYLQRNALQRRKRMLKKSTARPSSPKRALDRLRCPRAAFDFSVNKDGKVCYYPAVVMFRDRKDPRRFTFTVGSKSGNGYFCGAYVYARWNPPNDTRLHRGKKYINTITWDNNLMVTWKKQACK